MDDKKESLRERMHRLNHRPDTTNMGAPLRDLLVRGFTADDMDRLDSAASAAGMSRNEWAKRVLLRAALAPVVRKHYGLKGVAENGASIYIDRYERYGNPVMDVEEEFANLSDEQEEIYRRAVKLVQRNEPGDREKAIGLLQQGGFEVFEVPATPPPSTSREEPDQSEVEDTPKN